VEAPRWDKFAASLTNAPGQAAYPLASFTFLYIKTGSSLERTAALSDLLDWFYSDGQQLATRFNYGELPPSLLATVRKKIVSLK
jgi:ABC-type phosphate transport system substrate-binding protein